MVRRLDKIEKEMGYCEIRLEKERRLRKQVVFLQADLEALGRILRDLEAGAHPEWEDEGVVAGVPVSAVAEAAAAGTEGLDRYRKAFVTAGVRDNLREERELLARELDGVEERLKSYTSFEDRQLGLLREKRLALRGLAAEGNLRMRRVNEDFRRIEDHWNSLAEDLINIDEALFFLEGNIDYLRSARGFLVSARATFDLAAWIRTPYETDLLRHSDIGRAREMVDGADRNVKLAEKELVCLANARVPIEDLRRATVPFFGAIFDDLFIHRRIESAVHLVEEIARGNERVLGKARERRKRLEAEKLRIETERERKYSEMGAVRRRFVCR
ncbi:MAG: hypothetical protein JXP34_01490 [Planctomycetes bacterium]|nr:hypothetical protein [Planctomycetota bacterium]